MRVAQARFADAVNFGSNNAHRHDTMTGERLEVPVRKILRSRHFDARRRQRCPRPGLMQRDLPVLGAARR